MFVVATLFVIRLENYSYHNSLSEIFVSTKHEVYLVSTRGVLFLLP